jgi:carbamoyl-phosphate synthase large subunit
LIGAKIPGHQKAEDRDFNVIHDIGLAVPRSGYSSFEAARQVLRCSTSIIRPSFTLGGTGGNVAYNIRELRNLLWGLAASPRHQVLIEVGAGVEGMSSRHAISQITW